ncbi:MAG: LemA family protein, partial [Hydrogenophaga sp.]
MHTSFRSPFARLLTWLSAVLLSIGLTGCGYNDFQRLDEQTQSAWSEVLNQYQRRADLIPNLVETAKGASKIEQSTLEGVIQARASATQTKLST